MSGLERDLAVLQRLTGADVMVPGSPTYERLPAPFNARFDGVVPRARVVCTSPDDVAETVRVAARHRVGVTIRGGGHCSAGRSCGRGIVIDTAPMSAVSLSGAWRWRAPLPSATGSRPP
jgi:FAD/FMN-containing dehydrogenase